MLYTDNQNINQICLQYYNEKNIKFKSLSLTNKMLKGKNIIKTYLNNVEYKINLSFNFL